MSKKKKLKTKASKAAQVKKTLTGTIQTTRQGVGFVTTERFDSDVRVEAGLLNTAMDGDTVEISLLPSKYQGKQWTGEVLRVVERAKTTFVGVTDWEDGFCFVVPDGRRAYFDFLIKDPDKSVVEGTKVVVELKKWTDPEKDPIGRVVEVLGKQGEHEVEIQSIIRDRGIDTHFPPEVDAEAKQIHADWQQNGANYIEEAVASGERRDFRGVTTITIDPLTAKDFDDAISLRILTPEPSTLSPTYEIGIHIADVSHYVRPGTALDREARERGFSTYLVDRTIPMLPEELSNDLCSLNPNVDRLAFSAVFTLNDKAEVLESWFGKGVIHSDKRFTYEEAQERIETQKGDFYEEVTTLNELAKQLKQKRFKEGAIDFEQSEVQFELDEQGNVEHITRKERFDAHKLVEECMLLANRGTAKMIFDAHEKEEIEGAFVYRVHASPEQEKIDELAAFLSAIGFELDTQKKVTPKVINDLFKQIVGSPVENLVKTAAIRTMQKAVYSTNNIGHFGLGFTYYTHFTSPIRRYADLLVHRVLQEHVVGNEFPPEQSAQFRKIALELSDIERNIQEAERSSIKYKQVEYMSTRIGQEFEGIITGVTEFGIFIEEIESGAEGLVAIRTIGDEYFTYDQKHYRLVGEETKKTYTLGDRLRFKVAKADVDKRTLDYVLI